MAAEAVRSSAVRWCVQLLTWTQVLLTPVRRHWWLHFMRAIATITGLVSGSKLNHILCLVGGSQKSTETLSILGDALIWLPKWQSVPAQVLSPHRIQINDALVATGAVHGAY